MLIDDDDDDDDDGSSLWCDVLDIWITDRETEAGERELWFVWRRWWPRFTKSVSGKLIFMPSCCCYHFVTLVLHVFNFYESGFMC